MGLFPCDEALDEGSCASFVSPPRAHAMLLGFELARRQNRQLRSGPDRKKRGLILEEICLGQSLLSLDGVSDVVLGGTTAYFTAKETELSVSIYGLDWRAWFAMFIDIDK